MPADTWTDIARMAACYSAVAAVAIPVGLACRGGASRLSPSLRPRRLPYTGLDLVVGLFVVVLVVPALVGLSLDQSGVLGRVYGPDDPPNTAVRGLWAGFLAAPLQLVLIYTAYRYHFPPRDEAAGRSTVASIRAGVRWWVVLTLVVLVVHAVVNAAFTELGFAAEEHPLTRLGVTGPGIERVAFVLQAAVFAPVLEEVVFRGALLGWLVAGRLRPTGRRVWAILVTAVAAAAVTRGDSPASPVAFAALLAGGWGLLQTRIRKQRMIGGVYASAALFAAIHSPVWPTPIPLFVLGLGLGWVAVRTNSVLAPAIVHGLFNAVSVLFVLSGGAK